MKRNLSVLVFVVLFFLNAIVPVFAGNCPNHLALDSWSRSFGGGENQQFALLKTLKACLPDNKKLQEDVDDVVTDSLMELEKKPGKFSMEAQKSLVDFNLKALLANAQAGLPASQHNYAALHNAQPGSLLQKLVPQDYALFLYWTRKAAAQGEPRAIFNLAIRLADGDEEHHLQQDLKTAFTLFSILQVRQSRKKILPVQILDIVSKGRSNIAEKLGKMEVAKIDLGIPEFRLASLAPVEDTSLEH
jgi:hypothetical protein